MNLDHLELLHLIAETGSFRAAAQKARRAPSAVSMAVKGLEDEWGFAVFDRDHYRATLTDQGRAMVEQVRRLLEQRDGLLQLARSFKGGVEASLSLSINNLFPIHKLDGWLVDFEQKFPDVRLNLRFDHMDRPLKRLQDRQVDLAIALEPRDGKPPQLEGQRLLKVELIGVGEKTRFAHGKITKVDLAARTQIVVSEFTQQEGTTSPSGGIQQGDRKWYVADHATKLTLIRKGLGYGYMPDYLVEDDLSQGTLCELENMPRVETAMSLYRIRGDHSGPAKSYFWERSTV